MEHKFDEFKQYINECIPSLEGQNRIVLYLHRIEQKIEFIKKLQQKMDEALENMLLQFLTKLLHEMLIKVGENIEY
jgi:restriction endonuclease S subunit